MRKHMPRTLDMQQCMNAKDIIISKQRRDKKNVCMKKLMRNCIEVTIMFD